MKSRVHFANRDAEHISSARNDLIHTSRSKIQTKHHHKASLIGCGPCTLIALAIVVLFWIFARKTPVPPVYSQPSNSCTKPTVLNDLNEWLNNNDGHSKNILYTKFIDSTNYNYNLYHSTLSNTRQTFENTLKRLWNTAMYNENLFFYKMIDDNENNNEKIQRKIIIPSKKSNVEKSLFFELLYNPKRIAKLQHKNNENNNKQHHPIQWVEPNIPVKSYQTLTIDSKKFNFWKVNGKDIMFMIDNDDCRYKWNDIIDDKDDFKLFGCFEDDSIASKDKCISKSKHLIIINKFPIGNYSGLFLPNFLNNNNNVNQNQILLKESLHSAVCFSNYFESKYIRIGFNSMGAMASVNHLHFQFWEIKTLHETSRSNGMLPVEYISNLWKISYKKRILSHFDKHRTLSNINAIKSNVFDGVLLQTKGNIIVYELKNYPVHTLVFEHYNTFLNDFKIDFKLKYEENDNNDNDNNQIIPNVNWEKNRIELKHIESQRLDENINGELLYYLWNLIECLIDNNIPHNLVINRQQIFVFIRQSQHSSNYPIFYGFCDVAGWITFLEKNAFNNVTIEDIISDIKDNISIDDKRWDDVVKKQCMANL